MGKTVCRVTHDIILAGRCPWCDSIIIDGEIRSTFPDYCSGRSSFIKWDIAALLKAFSIQPKEYVLSMLSGLLLHDSRTEPFFSVFSQGIQHADSDVRRMTVRILTQRGIHLLSHEAEQYERMLEDMPYDVVIRIILLCYYTNAVATLSGIMLSRRQRHIMWMIENYPELLPSIGPYASLDLSVDSEEVFQQAKELWKMQIGAKENDPSFLVSMAAFLDYQDPVLSGSLYKKAINLEPNNSDWRKNLAHHYVLRMCDSNSDVERRELAKMSLSEYEAAFILQTDQLGRFWLLPDLAKLAYEAEEFEKARHYANEMLRMVSFSHSLLQNNGDAIHYGHYILGRLALRQGDREKAKWHLLESGKSIGSPVLNSFGPKMSLAKELLDLGERDVVIQYLNLCSNFWLSMDHKPQQWIYTIEHGGIPDFGANL